MSVSVIIPSFRADLTLPRVLSALRPQVGAQAEVIVVDSSGINHATALQREYPWIRVIGLGEKTLPGKARNIGVRAAAGRRLAFVDADAIPASDWLSQLEMHLDRGNVAAVAGAVHNGTPASVVGTASYLIEFSEVMPARRGRPLHAASCNLLVDRTAFENAGGFAEDIWPGEDTILTVPWSRASQLQFAAAAGVWHLNRTRLRDFLAHQFRLGRSFVWVSCRTDVPYRRFSEWPFLVLAPGLRLVTLIARLIVRPPLLRRALLVVPLVALGLLVWTAGVAIERTSTGQITG